MAWLTPDSIPAEHICRELSIPNEPEIIAAVYGAILELTYPHNWEQFGTVTPEAMASAMAEMFTSLVDASEGACGANMEAPILIFDQKAQNTDGGSFNSGAWRVRDLNVLVDLDSIGASLSSNEFTLPAGRWLIEWGAPARLVTSHMTRLWSVTENTSVGLGSSAYCPNADNEDRSFGAVFQNNSAETTYRIEHRCTVTRATDGFGFATNLEAETYTQVKCTRYLLP